MHIALLPCKCLQKIANSNSVYHGILYGTLMKFLIWDVMSQRKLLVLPPKPHAENWM